MLESGYLVAQADGTGQQAAGDHLKLQVVFAVTEQQQFLSAVMPEYRCPPFKSSNIEGIGGVW
jgi:hypothetical protein